MKILFPEFQNKKQQFEFLLDNKADLIKQAKSTVKFCDPYGIDEMQQSLVKSLNVSKQDVFADTDTEIERTIIGNTYRWMDSHEDVHLDNVFGVSLTQRQKDINHFHDHINQVMARVGVPKAIYESMIDWTSLGVSKAGQTMALFMDSRIKRILNQSVFDQYKEDMINQHSVGMIYKELSLAVNDPERKAEYAEWQRYYPILGNPQEADQKGFFWAIKEAKLIEISCVIRGSNSLTPTLTTGNKQSPEESSSNIIDPAVASQKLKKQIIYLNN